MIKLIPNPQSTIGKIILFLLKLVIIFLIFDYFFLFLIGASVKGGIYIPLLEKYNIIHLIRDTFLHSAGLIISLFGYSYTITRDLLSIHGGSGVILGYSCYGFSITSMFLALILAYPRPIRTKWLTLVVGLLTIFILNVFRIAGLAIIYTKSSQPSLRNIDHHMVFNIIVYLVIFGIYYWYVNSNQSEELSTDHTSEPLSGHVDEDDSLKV